MSDRGAAHSSENTRRTTALRRSTLSYVYECGTTEADELRELDMNDVERRSVFGR
jgi:hypothetical protein